MRCSLALAVALSSAGCTTVAVPRDAATVVRALDERQRQLVVSADVAALEALAHPNLRINAPTGRVLTREEFLSSMRDGRISAEQFERTAESVTISGKVAAVMGRETFTPTAASELGRMYGARPLQRRYSNIYVWEGGAWRWLARHANVAQAPPQHSPMHLGVPGRCEDKAKGGGGAEGCYWNASLSLGRATAELYWHIDRFPDVAAAEAARTTRSAVTTALGAHVFLQTVTEDASWRPRGGERLSTVGPFSPPPGTELTARFMEATTSKESVTVPHLHSGPEGFFLLEGSICVETPAGAHRAGPGASLALPGGVPMQLSHAGSTARRSLVLVIHPSAEPWIDRQPQWKPAGACRG